MHKMLLRVTCETLGDQLHMKEGWELEHVLEVRRVGGEYHWHLVVSKMVEDEDA